MISRSTEPVTSLLAGVRRGDERAREALLEAVYDDLRGLARRHLRAEASSHTLQPTALVHEAYMRLGCGQDEDWESRAHFFASCAVAMRRILVEHARKRGRHKRGGEWRRIALPEDAIGADSPALDLLALDEALHALAALDPLRAHVVELRFFGGMTIDETARFLDLSVPTVSRYWRLAKAWLYRRLYEEEGSGEP